MAEPVKKYCDLVMKGGVTSGVVYPLAVVELASEYWFKNIGGTSAGAIAAGVTAAAECNRRRTGNGTGFDRLSQLPTDLAKDGFLLSLFRADPSTKKAFDVVLAGMAAKQSGRSVLSAALVKICRNFSSALLPGVFIAAIVTAVLWFLLHPHSSWVLYGLLGFLVWFLATVYFLTTAVLKHTNNALLNNGFGFCTGFDSGAEPGRAPLANWLYALLNEVAGQEKGIPLTFGDLWDAPQYLGEPELANQFRCLEFEKRSINLEVMTTNLTLGAPSRIPFDAAPFYFQQEEWSKLFPPEVVDWMVTHSRKGSRPAKTRKGAILVPMPEMRDLPVLVAIRMSLSFPILLSAVPLYAVDYSLKMNRGASDTVPIEADKCWFSDGGISSNFPIHFFDSPLPRWPTFGIDLKSPHPDYNTEKDYVWLPTKNSDGLQETWNHFEDHGLFGLFGAIFNVMQDWRDNLQMLIPGYRDRVVHISHTNREGGLNLKMDPQVIKTMSERGRRAGQELLTKFNWDNHAWVRYRSSMCCLETTLERFATSYANPIPQDQTIWPVIRGMGVPPSYTWKGSQTSWAPKATVDLVDLVTTCGATGNCFCDGAPRPRPELRIGPKV